MKQLKDKEKLLWNICGCTLLMIQIILWIYTNCHFHYIEDDDAAKLFYHTLEMWNNKTILIPQWKYITTAEWDCSSLLAIPLYGMTGDIIISFGIANIVNMLLFVAVVMLLLQHCDLSFGMASLIVAFILIPFSVGQLYYANMLFFSGCQYIYKVLLPLWLLELMTIQKKRLHSIVNIIQTILFFILYCISVLSSGIYVFVCGMIPIFIYEVVTRLYFKTGAFTRVLLLIIICVITGIGFAVKSRLGVTTLSEEMHLVTHNVFLPHLEYNILSLLSLFSATFPNEVIPLYSLSSVNIIVKFTMVLLLVFIGLQPIRRIRINRNETGILNGKDIDLARKENLDLICAMIFCWNMYVQQLSIPSARYHLMGGVPLIISAGMMLYQWTTSQQNKYGSMMYAVLLTVLILCIGVNSWKHLFDAIPNYWEDYNEKITDYADQQDTKTIVYFCESRKAEIMRIIDTDKTYTTFSMPNTEAGRYALVTYDNYIINEDRITLDDRHLLVFEDSTRFEDMPFYLQPMYKYVGDCLGDDIYVSEKCALDGLSGPFEGYETVDYPFTFGYFFDGSMTDEWIFPEGEERLIIKSPEFININDMVRVSVSYETELETVGHIEYTENDNLNIMEINGKDSIISFEVCPNAHFSFSLYLDEGKSIIISEIRFTPIND